MAPYESMFALVTETPLVGPATHVYVSLHDAVPALTKKKRRPHAGRAVLRTGLLRTGYLSLV